MGKKERLIWVSRALWALGALFALMACIALTIFAFKIGLTEQPLMVDGSFQASDGIGWENGRDFYYMIKSIDLKYLKSCGCLSIASALSFIVAKALSIIAHYKK